MILGVQLNSKKYLVFIMFHNVSLQSLESWDIVSNICSLFLQERQVTITETLWDQVRTEESFSTAWQEVGSGGRPQEGAHLFLFP